MLNKGDFNKIEKGSAKGKKSDGAVYSNVGGVVDFHQLKDVPIKKKPLELILLEQANENMELRDKISTLKNGILEISMQLEQIKIILAKYGME